MTVGREKRCQESIFYKKFMPRRQIHAEFSIVIVLSIWLIFNLFSSPSVIQYLLATIFFIIGSVAPDLLEPSAYHSFQHRKFFHSVRLLLILIIAAGLLAVIWLYLFKSQYILYIGSLLLGYIIHLIADAPSKMGLPLK